MKCTGLLTRYLHVSTFSDTIHFDNYREFLLYTFNSMIAEGKVQDILDMVKAQPKGKSFNFDLNMQEGR